MSLVARLAIALAIVVVASIVSTSVRRRRSVDAPTQARHQAPSQLDRRDFVRPDAGWLVAVFTSATCQTCADSVAKAAVLTSTTVAVEEVEYHADPARHRKYQIDAVPTTVIADQQGVVQAAFLGRVTATDLWAAMAEARVPGSRPARGCDHHGDASV